MHAIQAIVAIQLIFFRFSGAVLPKFTKDLTITAVYGATEDGHKEIQEVKKLEKGETHIFEEKSEDMGSWRMVREIISLKAKVGDKEVERDVKKDCERVHANIDYNVDKDGSFKVMQ